MKMWTSCLYNKFEAGEHIGPILLENIKDCLIDIDGAVGDGTLTEESVRMVTGTTYPNVITTHYRGEFTDLIKKEVTIEVFDDGNHN